MEIEFHDREKELRDVQNVINSRPDLITFVYGPINSGKTELFNHLIKTLPNNYKVFYINLRGIYVSKADDFLKVLFEVEDREANIKDYLKTLVDCLPDSIPIGGIPIPKNLFKEFFEERETENVFRYIENLFEKLSEKYTPILIVDELQKIGDVKIDGSLIYELFNLFIRLTKELHSCHVFAISSDSLFIERVYSEAMLQGRAEFLLVDDFDYETTVSFLKKYNLRDDEVKLVWDYFGGKPVYLVRAVKAKHASEDLKGLMEKYLKIRVRQIKDAVYEFDQILRLFEEFGNKESFEYNRLSEEIRFCVKKNILFVDPVESIVKPQSRLDLLATRKVLDEF